MDRGMQLVPLHFSQYPLTDTSTEQKSVRICETLGLGELYVARIAEAFDTISQQCHHKYYFVLTKRFMIRVACGLANIKDCDFLVTGESLGQVSSQTLRNLGAIASASDRSILRPLLGFDKQEIMDRAKRLGTYDISTGPEMCDLLGPDHPSTRVDMRRVLEEEAKLDYDGLVGGTLKHLRLETLKGKLQPSAGENSR